MLISDNINEDWLNKTDELADLFERGQISIDRFSTDQLHYLVYWNFGVSGIHIMPETKLAEKELEIRGEPYNEEYAQLIDTEATKFY